MSADRESVSHEEALRLIDQRIGERAYLALFLAADAEVPGTTEGRVMFVGRVARLVNPIAPDPPRLGRDVGYYAFDRDGADAYPLPPIAEKIEVRDSGLDFHLAGGALLRVAWQGSSEVGDRRDVGTLVRLRRIGLASSDESREDDASIELRRFLRDAPRAPAEVLSARPTEERNQETGSRVWELRLRVLAVDGAPFKASADVVWPENKEIDERLARGESPTCLPTEKARIEVAYDPERPEEVMAYPDSPSEPPPIPLRLAIVARPIREASSEEPRRPPPDQKQRPS